MSHPEERAGGGDRGIAGQTSVSPTAGIAAAVGPARMAVLLGLVLALLSVPACVTQNIQFQPPMNYPPAIEPSANDTPLIRLDLLTSTSDGGTGGDVVLDVTVRDPNVEDALTYRVFRSFLPSEPFALNLVQQNVVPGDGESPERPLTVVLPVELFLERACNRVELFVSRGFQSVAGREPVIPGDLGTRTWFVVRDGSVTIDDCAPWFQGQ